MKKIICIVLFFTFLFLGFGEAKAATISEGIYKIQSALDSNKVLDVRGGSTNNKTRIQLYDWNNVDAQKWKVTHIGGNYYTITTVLSDNKVLDVRDAGKKNETAAQIYSSNKSDAQKWLIKYAGNGYYYIISKCNNLYLDVREAKKDNGTDIQLYKGNGSKAQKFKLIELIDGKQSIKDGSYIISSSLNNNKVLDIAGGNDNNWSNVQLYDNLELWSQIWNVKYLNNGYYSITSYLNDNKSLDVMNGDSFNGANIQIYNNNGSSAQKWIIKDTGDGFYNIISQIDNLYVDVYDARTANETNIQLYHGNGSKAQKFKFIEFIDGEHAIEEGTYTISSSLNNNKVLDIAGGNDNNWSNVQLYDNLELWSQIWNVKYLNNGYYSITSYLNDNKSLDVMNGDSFNGANIQIYNNNGSSAQKWIIKDTGDGFYNIISQANNLYVDVYDARTTNETNIQLYRNNGSKAQKFKFNKIEMQKLNSGIYTINSVLNQNLAIGLDKELAVNWGNVQLNSISDANNQKWHVEHIKNGYYKISSAANSNKVLDVANGGKNNGTNVQIYASNNSSAQKWYIKYAGNGSYSLIAQNNNLFVDVTNGNAIEGTNIQMYKGNDGNAQKFVFKETTVNTTQRSYEDGYYYIFSSLNTSKALDVAAGRKQNGTNIQIYHSNSSVAQTWYLKYLNNGYYSITSSMNPRICMSVKDSGLNNKTNVQIDKCTGADNQQWMLKDVGNGLVSFISKVNSLYLDIDGNAALNNANVYTYQDNNKESQKFKLVENTNKKIYTGIDISYHQGNIDWQKVSDSAIGFVIIRAGYETDSGQKEDSKFREYVANCEKYNIPYALYIFSYADFVYGDKKSAESEAKLALKLLNDINQLGYKPNLGTQVFIDMESIGIDPNKGKYTLTSMANTFCKKIEDNKYPCGVYANKMWLTTYLDAKEISKNYVIWLAQYPYQSGMSFEEAKSFVPSSDYDFYKTTDFQYWQFTSKGYVNGIKGNVDFDLGYDIFEN